MNALLINLAINEFSWHIYIGACESMRKMLFKKKKDSTKAYNNNSISNELTENGSHVLTSVKVSNKQVSNI